MAEVKGINRSQKPFVIQEATEDESSNLIELKNRSGTTVWSVDKTGRHTGPPVSSLTYGATIATDATLGNAFTIVATNSTAFTISNPTNPEAGQAIAYDIKNSSGGVMGAVTWGAEFLLAGLFTNPANTRRRTITFYYDGTNWVETNRAGADI